MADGGGAGSVGNAGPRLMAGVQTSIMAPCNHSATPPSQLQPMPQFIKHAARSAQHAAQAVHRSPAKKALRDSVVLRVMSPTLAPLARRKASRLSSPGMASRLALASASSSRIVSMLALMRLPSSQLQHR